MRVLLAILLATSAGALRRQKAHHSARELYGVNHSSLQSIESRVQQAQTHLKHRERVRQHIAQQVDVGMAARLELHT